uniref:YY1-associated factor 2 n=1 Tax=Homo sapiens TaxID=9606 RepID=UPI0000D8949C|nr:Chain A, YY1-associated factor 2 [Homo sapiens]
GSSGSSGDEGYWDCSVCTFRNSAEAFKCMMCDVRKGTSTRKPRPVSQSGPSSG